MSTIEIKPVILRCTCCERRITPRQVSKWSRAEQAHWVADQICRDCEQGAW
jgi:hypothetical protein